MGFTHEMDNNELGNQLRKLRDDVDAYIEMISDDDGFVHIQFNQFLADKWRVQGVLLLDRIKDAAHYAAPFSETVLWDDIADGEGYIKDAVSKLA